MSIPLYSFLVPPYYFQCSKCFNRNFALFSEKDKFCDFCSNQFIHAAKTPESKIVDETKFIMDACFEEIIDNKNPWFSELEDKHLSSILDEEEERQNNNEG